MTNDANRPQSPYPKFFTRTQWRTLLANDQQETPLRPVVKLFMPDGGATWLIASVSPAEPDLAFGLCDLGLGFPELGYVSLAELAGLRGQIGLPVERERYCTLNQTLQQYADRANQLQHIEV